MFQSTLSSLNKWGFVVWNLLKITHTAPTSHPAPTLSLHHRVTCHLLRHQADNHWGRSTPGESPRTEHDKPPVLLIHAERTGLGYLIYKKCLGIMQDHFSWKTMHKYLGKFFGSCHDKERNDDRNYWKVTEYSICSQRSHTPSRSILSDRLRYSTVRLDFSALWYSAIACTAKQ